MASTVLEREESKYVANRPRSRKLQVNAARYLPGGSTRGVSYFDPYPFFIDHGEGHHVYDIDGNCYLDFMMNATSLFLGHAHPLVVHALQAQAEKGTAFSGPTETQIRLANILCDRLHSVDSVRFTNSGSEATMMAIRAARAFTGKHKIAKFEGAYHGSHDYVCVSVTPSAEKLDPSGPTAIPEAPGHPSSILHDVIVLPYNDLESCERIVRQNKDDLAVVIMEAVVANLRFVCANPGFLRGMRELTRSLDILLIFDEVVSFRVAPGGAQEMFGVAPDLTALGKIIGGGMPVGALGGRQDIMSLYDPSRGRPPRLAHPGTFNANPMTMVAGEVVLNQMTPQVYQRCSHLGEMVRQKLRDLFSDFKVPVQITGCASLFGIYFTSEHIADYRSTLRSNQNMMRCLFIGLLNEGVLLHHKGFGALSAITTESDVNELVDATRRVIQRIR